MPLQRKTYKRFEEALTLFILKAFSDIKKELGSVDVMIYNAAARRFQKTGIVDLTTEEFVNFWKINCLGAFFASREVVPDMLVKGQGTIIFTGEWNS